MLSQRQTYAFRAFVQALLIFLRLADALCMALPFRGTIEYCTAVNAGKGRVAHHAVLVQLGFLDHI